MSPAPSVNAPPAGLVLREEMISPDEETRLIALIESIGLELPAYDPGNRRASASFGWKYDHAGDRFRPCPPLPAGLVPLRDRTARIAGVEPGEMIECLLNRYEPGALIQSHLDKPVWEHVIGVSLGAPATMVFRRERADGEEVIRVDLPPRSAYLLAGDARYEFEHSLPPQDGTRWSVAFRTLSDEGRQRLRAGREL